MTTLEAIEIITAKAFCAILEFNAYNENGKGCDLKCDSCDYCYKQGTKGEQEEALQLFMLALRGITK